MSPCVKWFWWPGAYVLFGMLTAAMNSNGAVPEPVPLESRLPAEFRLPDGRAIPAEISLATARRLMAEARWDPAFNTAMSALGWTWERTYVRSTKSMSLEDEIEWMRILIEVCRHIDEPGLIESALLGLCEVLPRTSGFSERELIGVYSDLAEARYRVFLPSPDPEGSLKAADRGVEIAQRLGLQETTEARVAQVWRCLALYRLDQKDAARTGLEQLLSISDRLGVQPLVRLRVLTGLALIETNEGEVEKAYQHLNEALDEVRAAQIAPLEIALAQARAGYAALRAGYLDEAVALLTDVVPAIDRVTGWRHGHRHRVWLELGRGLTLLGRFRDAEFALRRAFDVAVQSNPSPRAASRLEPLLELARLRRWAGDLAGATERTGILLTNLPVEGDPFHRLNSEILLEAIRQRLFRGENPESLIAQARASIPDDRPAVEERLLLDHWTLHWQSTTRPPAELVPRAAGLARAGEERLGHASAVTRDLHLLHGKLLSQAGRPDLAVAALRRALLDKTDAVGRERQDSSRRGPLGATLSKIEGRKALIRVLRELKRREEALEELNVLERETAFLVQEILALDSESLRLTAGHHCGDIASLAFGVAEVSRAAELALRRKGLVFESLMVDEDLDLAASSSPQAKAAVQAWRRTGPGKGEASVTLRTGFSPIHLRVPTEVDLDRLEEQTGVKHSAWRALRVDLKEIQSALDEQSVLIEYYGYPDEAFPSRPGKMVAFILTRTGAPRMVDLGEVGLVYRKIGELRAAWKTEDPRLLEELAKGLLWPLVPHVPTGARTWIIAPFGRLHFVPYALLPMPDGEALVEKADVVRVSTGRDLVTRTPPGSNEGLVVVAGPAYASAESAQALSTMPRFRSAGLHDLPASRVEGDAVVRSAGAVPFQMAQGRNASEPWVRSLVSPRWLHFATHAFVLPPPDPFSAEAEWLLQPMERAALALSGAGDTLTAWFNGGRPTPGSDGILTAAEIGTLNLQGTELVVVSACESAAGSESDGDGVLGLGRGFFRAGARQVMLSHAEVEDSETAVFMEAFYQRLFTGQAPTQALAALQRERIREMRRKGQGSRSVFSAGPWLIAIRGQVGTQFPASTPPIVPRF